MAQQQILADSPEKLIRKYWLTLKSNDIPVEKIILFGSRAKGTAHAWSDIDVCVVSKSFGNNPFNELITLKKLTRLVETLIEPVPYHPHDLEDKYDPLAKEIRTYGIQIV